MGSRVLGCVILVSSLLVLCASVAAGAPAMGVYLGGDVMRYYSLSEFVTNEEFIRKEMTEAGLENVAAVDQNGRILVGSEAVLGGTFRDV